MVYEESYCAERGDAARAEDPWLQIIPCRLGHIFPWGGSTLAASTNTRGGTARNLAPLDFTTVAQDGDDGLTVLFPVEKFAQVAELMKPRRRRQISETERARLADMGRKYGYQARISERQGEIVVNTAK